MAELRLVVGDRSLTLDHVRAELAGRLSDQAIRAAVGPGAYGRGAVYAREGRISNLTVDPEGRLVSATVRGSRGVRYHTIVAIGARQTGRGDGLRGTCTCPVGADCKHVAALALTARDVVAGGGVRGQGGAVPIAPGTPAVPPAPGTPAVPITPVATLAPVPSRPPVVPAWERSIAEIVRGSTHVEAAPGVPLALQFEVMAPPPVRRPYGSPPPAPSSGRTTASRRLRLQPLVPGKTGKWIRSGVSWRDIQTDYGRERRNPAQREALAAMYAAYQATRPGYYYGDGVPFLDELGPAVWRLLAHTVESGVALVPAKGSAGSITLAGEGADLAVDLRRDASRGDVTLDALVTIEGRALNAASASFLGDPVHGVILDADDDAAPHGLVLAPLRTRTSPRIARLVGDGGRLRIPAADVDRFLAEYYPGLRQVVTVASSDATVALPEIAPPALALVLTHEPGNVVRLEWFFDYRMGDAVRRVPLAGAPESGLARDPAAERSLLGSLVLADERLPQLWTSMAERALVPRIGLTGMDAVAFVEEVLPGLRAREDVVVEVVGEAPDYRHAEAPPVIRVSATDSPDHDWFDLGVTVSVEGEEVPFRELFLALAHGDSHLILGSGTYFSIERPEYERLRRLIEEARGLEDRPGGVPRISKWQAGLWEELVELGVVDEQSARWTSAVGGLLELGDVPRPAVPAGIDAELRPYQVDGYHWLSFLWDRRMGGILADDMGLGKTLQALAVICRAREAGDLAAPVLVVAPTSVVPNWAHEAARFAPDLRVVSVFETGAKSGVPLAERAAGADVVITSYALFRIEYDAYDALPWSGLVLDEAQFVKNYQAKTYQCARRLSAPFKLAITGTPLENSLMDLWALLSIVAPGLFPSPKRFTEAYRTPIEREGNAERLATLRRRIRPLMRRRTKEQVAGELPPKLEQVLDVTLNPRHQRIYDTHLQRERQKVLGMLEEMDKNRIAIFRALTALRQLSLDPALVDPAYAGVKSSKVDVLVENLREVVSEGHRALVFSQFTGFLRVVRDRLDAEGVAYTYLDGRTRDRAVRIAEFKNGSAPVFLISLKAGGFGLNLTEADYVFVLDPWWNPAVEAQAVDRTHRIGQDKTVMVYRMVSTGTIEEKVMALKARKQDLFDRVMDDGAPLSAPLTAEDIRGLLA